jgi:hypothetical protein
MTTLTSISDWEEDRRNQHRDKAQVLLKLAEAVEDSNQRRRKASVVAATVTVDSLQPWAQEWTTQAAAVMGDSKTPPVSQDTMDVTRMIQTTLQSVVTAVYQLREHDHLQYQMLEMKYFDVKRHAFDVEHVNRKLQLQQNNSSNSNNQQQEEEVESWRTQLQQENYELRKQLRESCLDCRKLVQENYGLRKILLDAGVHWNVLINASRTHQAAAGAGETKLNEDDNNNDNNDNDDNSDVTTEEFQDAQEFIPSNNQESTATATAATDTATATVVPVLRDEKPQAPTTLPMLDQDVSTETASSKLLLSTPQRTVSTITSVDDSFTTVESNTPLVATTPASRQDREETATSTVSPTATATRTSSSGSRGTRRSSRKSVTFAAMASKLQQERTTTTSNNLQQQLATSNSSSNNSFFLSSSFSSFQSSSASIDNDIDNDKEDDEEDDDHEESIATSSNTLQQPISSSSLTPTTTPTETKEQQQHDRNLELLGVGGIFAASSAQNQQHSDNRYYPTVRRKSYSNHQQHPTSSGSGGNKSLSLFQKRRNSHHQTSNHRQALTAKEFMAKKSSSSNNNNNNNNSSKADAKNTFHIQMSSMTRPKSTTTLVMVSESLDPLEEERRLSALLGGFRQGRTCSTAPTTTTTPITPPITPSVSLKKDQEDGSLSTSLSSSNNNNNKSFISFRRPSLRRKTFQSRTQHTCTQDDEDDDDNRSVGSTKSLGRFLKNTIRMSPSRNKHKNGSRDDRSIG